MEACGDDCGGHPRRRGSVFRGDWILERVVKNPIRQAAIDRERPDDATIRDGEDARWTAHEARQERKEERAANLTKGN